MQPPTGHLTHRDIESLVLYLEAHAGEALALDRAANHQRICPECREALEAARARWRAETPAYRIRTIG